MPYNDERGEYTTAAGGTIRHHGERVTLDELRSDLTPDDLKIIKASVKQYERDLLECYPQLLAGVRTGDAQGSFTSTLQIKSAKKNRFKGKQQARVRAPREGMEFDMHLDTDGQLALGLGSDPDHEPEADPED